MRELLGPDDWCVGCGYNEEEGACSATDEDYKACTAAMKTYDIPSSEFKENGENAQRNV